MIQTNEYWCQSEGRNEWKQIEIWNKKSYVNSSESLTYSEKYPLRIEGDPPEEQECVDSTRINLQTKATI